VQTLKAAGTHPLERFEHEVPRADDVPNPQLHAGTAPGERLLALLRRADDDGAPLLERYRTDVRRTERTVRTRGAVVAVAFDEGRLTAGDASVRVLEIEFESVSGSVASMLALAERWCRRFGLMFDPRSKAERGDRLADGSPFAPLRKAERPDFAPDAGAIDAFAAVLDECLAQVTRTAVGLIDGDPVDRQQRSSPAHTWRRSRLRGSCRAFRRTGRCREMDDRERHPRGAQGRRQDRIVRPGTKRPPGVCRISRLLRDRLDLRQPRQLPRRKAQGRASRGGKALHISGLTAASEKSRQQDYAIGHAIVSAFALRRACLYADPTIFRAP
jgi:hypothetical protein